MSVDSVLHWQAGELLPGEPSESSPPVIEAADSWLIEDGRVLALGLHRERFFAAVTERRVPENTEPLDLEDFWLAAIAALPRTGRWFPRVELRSGDGAAVLVLRIRSAPQRDRAVVVATHEGPDPRTTPRRKGPDLERMLEVRQAVRPRGAGEAVLTTEEGYVIEGAYSGLLWWRGNILCGPPASFDRVDSVTVRSMLGLAFALGVETHEEAVTPAELAGTELWALSALHGIRIVTGWNGGPELAELPGRLALWRARLDALRQPL